MSWLMIVSQKNAKNRRVGKEKPQHSLQNFGALCDTFKKAE
jgi:hypothetical protein